MLNCPVCHGPLKRNCRTYCSNHCQQINQYAFYINRWKRGEVDGSRGIHARNISNYIKHYLLEKFDEKCVLCGWRKRNPTTGKVALEIDHINGNSEDNREENLRLICPNCHSLSSNYKNLNKGKGRIWRKSKYLKN